MRVSKETAILLKEAGYDMLCDKCYYADEESINHTLTELRNHNSSPLRRSAPTLHEATGWLRSKGVHVWVSVTHCWTHWQYRISIQGETHENRSEYIFNTHDLAYESGIVHGLKFVK